MDNTPTTMRGEMKCSDFNSNATCARGAKCPNAHGNFDEKNLPCALTCELMRRGGHKRGKVADVVEIDGRSQQLREQNRREHGE